MKSISIKTDSLHYRFNRYVCDDTFEGVTLWSYIGITLYNIILTLCVIIAGSICTLMALSSVFIVGLVVTYLLGDASNTGLMWTFLIGIPSSIGLISICVTLSRIISGTWGYIVDLYRLYLEDLLCIKVQINDSDTERDS